MKIVRYIVFVTFISTLSIAQANSNIVYIDIDFLIKNSNIGKASLDKLEDFK